MMMRYEVKVGLNFSLLRQVTDDLKYMDNRDLHFGKKEEGNAGFKGNSVDKD